MVQSPEKLQARLEEIQGAVERERQAAGEGERRARDLQARLDAVAKVGVCCLLVGRGAMLWLPASVRGRWASARVGMWCWLVGQGAMLWLLTTLRGSWAEARVGMCCWVARA